MIKGKNATWHERYRIALKEELTLKDIMILRAIGKPRAMELRTEVINYCLVNNLRLPTAQVPTDLVFLLTDKYLDYYYNMMVHETKLYTASSQS